MNLIQLKRHVSTALIGRSVCHDYQHAIHVEQVALHICQYLTGANRDEVSATALLHDVWDHKFVDDPALIETEFKNYLYYAGFEKDAIDRIIQNIELLSWSKGQTPKTLEGRIVQDADRITAMGATGIMRATAYGATTGVPFDVTVQHLIDKCLLLKDSLNFTASKRIAEGSHEFLVQFIELYKKETAI